MTGAPEGAYARTGQRKGTQPDKPLHGQVTQGLLLGHEQGFAVESPKYSLVTFSHSSEWMVGSVSVFAQSRPYRYSPFVPHRVVIMLFCQSAGSTNTVLQPGYK